MQCSSKQSVKSGHPVLQRLDNLTGLDNRTASPEYKSAKRAHNNLEPDNEPSKRERDNSFLFRSVHSLALCENVIVRRS